jgi:hypothetical protein
MARSTANIAESGPQKIEISTLDDRIASILTAIEQEKTPERLLKLAEELQAQLALRRQRAEPN